MSRDGVFCVLHITRQACAVFATLGNHTGRFHKHHSQNYSNPFKLNQQYFRGGPQSLISITYLK